MRKVTVQVAAEFSSSTVSLTPAPLGVGKPFAVKGTGFAPGATTVTIGNVEQSGVTSTATEIEGTVAAGTPLGDQTLTVTTADGSDSTPVTVAQSPQVGLDAVTRTAHPDGTLSLLFHGVEAGEDISFVQAVEDATSGELVRRWPRRPRAGCR